MKKRSIALIVALVLLVGIVAGGTIAWLMAETQKVTNTFTIGDINIDLDEPEATAPEGETDEEREYDVVPGDTEDKAPYVTVKAGSEPMYLFIKVTESNNYWTNNGTSERIVNWSVRTGGEGWTPYGEAVTNDDGSITYTYYKAITEKPGMNEYHYILTGDSTIDEHGTDCSGAVCVCGMDGCVTVNSALTKEYVDSMTVKPSLSFVAAAIQMENITDADGDGNVVDDAHDLLWPTT